MVMEIRSAKGRSSNKAISPARFDPVHEVSQLTTSTSATLLAMFMDSEVIQQLTALAGIKPGKPLDLSSAKLLGDAQVTFTGRRKHSRQ